MLDQYLFSNNWQTVYSKKLPKREGELFMYDSMGLSKESLNFLHSSGLKGLYKHQKLAIEKFKKGDNISLSTSTASGKSLVFYLSAIEILSKNSNARIMAIYPLKALCNEQEKRWRNAIKKSGLNISIGNINGGVSIPSREEIIKHSKIILATPDVLHAWFMSNLSNKYIKNFFSNLSIIVVDEVHTYSGVFGTNSAYLFRRIRHIIDLLGNKNKLQFIVASATIASPGKHLKDLFGVSFKNISSEYDSSPKQEVEIRLLNPPSEKDALTSLTDLMNFISEKTSFNFLTFADSRKEIEYITSILNRNNINDDSNLNINYDYLKVLDILPYRSGYEEEDRKIIEKRLSKGKVRGVVATSAFELGIDIPHLNMVILFGIPRSSTSFYQRIGRIGRHSQGTVLIINSGDLHSENIFKNPESIMNLPLTESSLYLKNPRIQYIHTLCLARHNGEHDQIVSNNVQDNLDTIEFKTSIDWPEKFLDLCNSERIGIVAQEFQSMKMEAGDDPNHYYPLRDIDSQFKIIYKFGPERYNLGSISYNQLMREAYPGAVYYHLSKPYRVYKVNLYSKEIMVRKEKRYTTKPMIIPTQIFPDTLNISNIYSYGETKLIECGLQIRKSIVGFKERRGSTEFSSEYPLNMSLNMYFNKTRFTRNYFSSGILIFHPDFNHNKIRLNDISEIIFEAFLSVIPFEKTDVNFANDRYRAKNGILKNGDRFICIYDETYGSLKLSSKILFEDNIKLILKKAIELSSSDRFNLNHDTQKAILNLHTTLYQFKKRKEQIHNNNIRTNSYEVKVIKPGSKGINIRSKNKEFIIESVFFSPYFKDVAYSGKYIGEESVIQTPIDSIMPIPGESNLAIYNLVTGRIKNIEA